MDKVLNKMGIYDIIAIWMSGALSLVLLYLQGRYVYLWEFSLSELPYKEFMFIILAYFVGIVLQEIGNLFQIRIGNMNGRYIRNVLKAPRKITKLLSSTYLSETEVNGINANLNAAYDDKTKYYYCRHILANEWDNREHNQSMAVGALSRSLSVGFCIFVLIGVCSMLACGYSCAKLGTVLTCLFLCLVLWFRSLRLMKMRYEKIFREFYYRKVLPNE